MSRDWSTAGAEGTGMVALARGREIVWEGTSRGTGSSWISPTSECQKSNDFVEREFVNIAWSSFSSETRGEHLQYSLMNGK